MLKNVTLSADETLIEKARHRASEEHKSLNELFREWMTGYVGGERRSQEYQLLMKRLTHARPGRAFSRDEMNER